MANTNILVPDIGDFSEVEVIEVLVEPGDVVDIEAPLITLESDKATMDVPSPGAGKVVEVNTKVGDRVSQGTLVVVLEGDDQAEAPAEPKTVAKPEGDAVVAPTEAAAPVTPARTPEPSDTVARQDEDAVPVKPMRRAPPASLPPPVERSGDVLPHASPGIRRFARELGADLSEVRGSGPKGRILKEDIKNHIKQRLAAPKAAQAPIATGAGIPAIPEVDFAKFGEVSIEDVPRIKKLSGTHLHRAWLNVPHVTQHDEADITELEAFRKQINSENKRAGIEAKVTLLAFAMKALCSAMARFPLFNASLSANGEKLVFKKYLHIGIAVDTPNGLMVPVFRDVNNKGVIELAGEMQEVSGRARAGKLRPDEMQGGCMSISSLGGIGGTAFTPIVNAPEVAILGLSRSRMQPVWDGENFVPRLMLPMSLSYDHRVIDGAEAARFTTWLSNALADPRRLLL